MAKKRFLVIADSFIGMTLIKAEQKKIVEIETDPELGGMRPGSNLVEVDDKGNPVAGDTASKARKTAKAPAAPPAGSGSTPPPGSGNANDLA